MQGKLLKLGFPIVILGLLSGLGCAPKIKPPQAALGRQPSFPPLNSLSALIEAKVEARGRSRQFEAALLAQAPNYLRISFLDDLGRELARLTANGRQVLWWESEAGLTEVFPQDGAALKEALNLPLGVNEFVKILLNGPKNIQAEQKLHVLISDLREDPKYPYHWDWYFEKPNARLQIFFIDLEANPQISLDRFSQ